MPSAEDSDATLHTDINGEVVHKRESPNPVIVCLNEDSEEYGI